MRTMNITISPGPRFFRAFLISALLLATLIWRLLKQGDRLFSAKVGLACCFVGLAFLVVWGAQRVTDQRWSWPAVFLAVCGATVAVIWLAVAVSRGPARLTRACSGPRPAAAAVGQSTVTLGGPGR